MEFRFVTEDSDRRLEARTTPCRGVGEIILSGSPETSAKKHHGNFKEILEEAQSGLCLLPQVQDSNTRCVMLNGRRSYFGMERLNRPCLTLWFLGFGIIDMNGLADDHSPVSDLTLYPHSAQLVALLHVSKVSKHHSELFEWHGHVLEKDTVLSPKLTFLPSHALSRCAPSITWIRFVKNETWKVFTQQTMASDQQTAVFSILLQRSTSDHEVNETFWRNLWLRRSVETALSGLEVVMTYVNEHPVWLFKRTG